MPPELLAELEAVGVDTSVGNSAPQPATPNEQLIREHGHSKEELTEDQQRRRPEADDFHPKVRTTVNKMLYAVMAGRKTEATEADVTKWVRKLKDSAALCGFTIDDESIRDRLKEAIQAKRDGQF